MENHKQKHKSLYRLLTDLAGHRRGGPRWGIREVGSVLQAQRCPVIRLKCKRKGKGRKGTEKLEKTLVRSYGAWMGDPVQHIVLHKLYRTSV